MGLGMVPITPGGLGVVEAGLTTWLLLSGVSADQAVVGTLLYRLASYWLPIPLGALAWAGWHVHRRLDLPDPADPEARSGRASKARSQSASVSSDQRSRRPGG